MNELIEFEDVVVELRNGLDGVHFDREPPSRRQTTRLMRWAPVALAALAVAIVATSLSFGGGIAWAAEARPPTAAEQAWISRDCADSLASDGYPASLPDLMTAEVRGETATLTFAGNGWFATCVVEQLNRSDGLTPGLSAIHMSTGNELPIGDGPIRLAVMGLMPHELSGTTFVTGTVATGIDQVSISVDDLDQDVQATVSNGWFTAWWPSRQPFVVRGFGPDHTLITEVAQR